MNAKTPVTKPNEVAEQWYVLDAAGVILGRAATRIATLLRGKHEPTFTPHVPGRNHVIVINAGRFEVTGNKREDKKYYRHGRRPGTLRERSLAEQLERHPTRPLEDAVRRMLPDNRLRQVWMNQLHLYPGSDHPHDAQKPTKVGFDG